MYWMRMCDLLCISVQNMAHFARIHVYVKCKMLYIRFVCEYVWCGERTHPAHVLRMTAAHPHRIDPTHTHTSLRDDVHTYTTKYMHELYAVVHAMRINKRTYKCGIRTFNSMHRIINAHRRRPSATAQACGVSVGRIPFDRHRIRDVCVSLLSPSWNE